MSVVTVLYALIFYAATALLVGGLARRIYIYWKTPAPLKIPTTPAPVTRTGVVVRLASEVVFFQSLFRSTKWTWLFGWMFHFGMLLVLLRHLRYFTDPVWTWVALIQPFGKYAAFAMVLGLLGLWGRRIFVDRVRYISSISDHLMLALLVLIGLSGMTMSFVTRTDIIGVKDFFIGLLTFDWHPLPTDFFLLVHLTLVAGLMSIFAFSKLLHGVGIFFSPTRNQVDNPREKRHLAAWAKALEENR